ncbi:lantibiotic dehydratase [Streptomyces sp. MS19]|uniref:lantibiotic dehydratase n=1 Tax=Streptomyces sp. MS19 TaxID=3385972 RepID=UPI0039A0C70F
MDGTDVITRTGHAHHWELGGLFTARVAGLPLAAVDGLRAHGSAAWAAEVLDAEERVRAAGGRVADLLHGLVGNNEDGDARRALLRLRREVFNNRLPRDRDEAVALAGGRDAAAGRALADWLADRAALAGREAAGPGLLAADLAGTRAALRELAAEERLRNGLLLASPSLDAELDTYLARVNGADGAAGGPDKRARKTERSLLAYLYRTACKTSPFSTFTGVALGTLGDGAPDTLRAAGPWTSRPRLNVAVLGRIAEAVVADPARRADLPVAPAPGWGREEDRVRYVRRWVTAGEDDTAVTFDTVRDRLFFLRRSGVLDRMLALLGERPALRYGELARWLADGLGAPAGDVERYLAALLAVGMVRVPSLDTGVHDTDPLRAFQRSLRALDRPWARETADALEGPARCLDRYPAEGPAGRRALLAELRERLGDVQRSLGAERARVPRTVLYEDVTVPSVTADRAAFTRAVAEPLRSVERVLPAFDLTLPQRLTFTGFFLARYGRGGRCDDLLRLIHDFHEDFFDQYLSFTSRRARFDAAGRHVPEENWLGLPRLKALDTARQVFQDGVRELWETSGAAGAGPGGPAELVLGEDLFARTADELADLSGGTAVSAHHVQLAAGEGDGPLVVLNRSYGGLSFPFSRFTHCHEDTDLAGRLRARARAVQPPGAVFAEVTGGPVTSNLNLHGRLTDYEIVCPGETSGVPADRRLALEELSLTHDPAADRLVLRSARLGREVVPVYLGYLVPLALPEVPRTLLLLSPTSMAPLDVWGGIAESAPYEGVTRRPRVRHGRLVLARRSWSAPAAVLPPRAGDAGAGGDAAWYLGWQRWRRRQGVPERVFATVADGGARGATGAKPQYVDFAAPLSLLAFEGLLRRPEARVVFREALPDGAAPGVTTERGAHVTEFAVETVRARHGEGTPEGPEGDAS